MTAHSAPSRIGICTDSSSQLSPALVERYGIEIVPVTLSCGEAEHLDGVDIDADTFYAAARCRDVVVSPPSPGQFALAYEALLERGCTEIVSLHGPSPVGGVVQAARLAAHSTPAPVKVVDTGIAGDGVACAAWAAADVAERLGCATTAIAATDHFADRIARFEIRLAELQGAAVEVVNRTVAEVLAIGERIRVAVGHSDHHAAPVADALEAALGESARVIDLVRYRIGPSAGDHAVPGLATCLVFSTQ